MKAKKLLVAMALALGLPAAAQAGLTFDPDGAGGLAPIDLGSLDWTQTSMLAMNGTAAVDACAANTLACGTSAAQFDLLLHATLVATANSAGTINTPSGLASSFEITMVARFTETVTAVTNAIPGTTTAAFATVPSAGGFLEFYFDSTPDANALQGAGFSNGRLILSATGIGASTGSFSVTLGPNGQPVIALLDQHSADDYGGQQTVTGSGSNSDIDVTNIAADPTFFLANPGSITLNFNNISQGLPFIQVDPSDCFTDDPAGVAVGTNVAGQCAFTHVSGTYLAQGPDANGGYKPNILAVNGLVPSAGGGPDQVFQTDFNSAIRGQTVPEPGSIALMGLGLTLAALMRRRQFPHN